MGRPRRTTSGVVTGFVLRLIRESVPCTQAALAEVLGVGVDTLPGLGVGGTGVRTPVRTSVTVEPRGQARSVP
ncbi:hypothetical protein GA0115260_100492 [Streptomyces sp. MnatMP-M27]|nr:hypothetical protein GA0115260_100492 [Streptomyces sp. MnatMP-M27]